MERLNNDELRRAIEATIDFIRNSASSCPRFNRLQQHLEELLAAQSARAAAHPSAPEGGKEGR